MSPDWPVLAAPRPFSPGDVHVWAFDRDTGVADDALLSAPERTRCDAFRLARDRLRYSAGRGALRRILAAYLDCAPQAVRLIVETGGKPALDGNVHLHPIRFNATASGAMALIALTRAADIGVDLEETSPFPDIAEVAAHQFSPAERAAVAAATGAERLATFYRCWTRKEAYLKALGTGLRQPLSGFTVCSDLDSPPHLVLAQVEARGEAWSIHHLAPRTGFVGAVACRASDVQLRTFTFATPARRD